MEYIHFETQLCNKISIFNENRVFDKFITPPCAQVCLTGHFIEVRDSQTGYLLPVRDAEGTLPDVESCWDAAAVAVAAVPPPATAPAPTRPSPPRPDT